MNYQHYKAVVWGQIFAIGVVLVLLAMSLSGCQTIESFLPPQLCKPAADLPSEKHVAKVAEIDTSNEALFGLLLHERKEHAKDDQDYNSLYSLCVSGVSK